MHGFIQQARTMDYGDDSNVFRLYFVDEPIVITDGNA